MDDHFPLYRQSWEPLSFATHFHSLDDTPIVGDGTSAFVFTSEGQARPYIQLFIRRLSSAWDGERYVGPKILAYHRSTFSNQARKARRAARHRRCTRNVHAVYAGWEGGVVYVGFDGVFEYASG